MTTQATIIEKQTKQAFQVINNIVVLKTNVMNRCPTSRDELAIELPRLSGIRKWAEANDQLQTIKLYMVQKTWGMHNFSAQEVSEFFHNN